MTSYRVAVVSRKPKFLLRLTRSGGQRSRPIGGGGPRKLDKTREAPMLYDVRKTCDRSRTSKFNRQYCSRQVDGLDVYTDSTGGGVESTVGGNGPFREATELAVILTLQHGRPRPAKPATELEPDQRGPQKLKNVACVEAGCVI